MHIKNIHCNFNTSHVSIKQPLNTFEQWRDYHFNTSHVSIKLPYMDLKQRKK